MTDLAARLDCFETLSEAELDGVTGGGAGQRIPTKGASGASGSGGSGGVGSHPVLDAIDHVLGVIGTIYGGLAV